MLAQLTYTSADYVDEKGAQSGWHIRQRSPQLSEAVENEIFRQIRPNFQPVNALPGFASADEIRSAEMRLSQTATETGAVLVNTVQAGNDTTGRPNTFSHACHIPFSAQVDFLGISTWRSEYWLTPLGAQAVSLALFDEGSELTLNEELDYEALVMLVEEPQRASFLMKLVDTLAQTWDVDVDSQNRKLLAVAVDSCNEAAQWVNAVSRVMSPARAWQLSWSLWERITHISSFEALQRANFDLVFFPRTDLSDINKVPDNVVLLDSSQTHDESVTTWWARFLKAVIHDQDTMDDVFDDLEALDFGLGDASRPEWMFSLAEASNRGILSQVDGDLAPVATSVLLPTSKIVLDESPMVSAIITEHLAQMKEAPFSFWQNVLMNLDRTAVLTPVLETVIHTYLNLGGADIAHIRSGPRLPEVARRLVGEWARKGGNIEFLSSLFYRLGDYMQTDFVHELDLQGLLWLSREGVDAWHLPALSVILSNVADGLIKGQIHDQGLIQGLISTPSLHLVVQQTLEQEISRKMALEFAVLAQGHPIQVQPIGSLLASSSLAVVQRILSDDFVLLKANQAINQWEQRAEGSQLTAEQVVATLLPITQSFHVRPDTDVSLIVDTPVELLLNANAYCVQGIPQTTGFALLSAYAKDIPCEHLESVVIGLGIREPVIQSEVVYRQSFDAALQQSSRIVPQTVYTVQWTPQTMLGIATTLAQYQRRIAYCADGLFPRPTEQQLMCAMAQRVMMWQQVSSFSHLPLHDATRFLMRRAAVSLLMLCRAGYAVWQVADSYWLREAIRWCTISDPGEVIEYFEQKHALDFSQLPTYEMAKMFFIPFAEANNPYAQQPSRRSPLGLLKWGIQGNVDLSSGTLTEMVATSAGELGNLVDAKWLATVPRLSEMEQQKLLAVLESQQTFTADHLLKLALPESRSRGGFFGFRKGE